MNLRDAPAGAFAVLDEFTAAFNRQDAAGMDAALHFPHVLHLRGTGIAIWNEPRSLDPEFFPNLVASGWAFTRYTKKEVLLASDDRIHFLVEYDRCRVDGSVLVKQAAVWIVTHVGGRWGIQIRSSE